MPLGVCPLKDKFTLRPLHIDLPLQHEFLTLVDDAIHLFFDFRPIIAQSVFEAFFSMLLPAVARGGERQFAQDRDPPSMRFARFWFSQSGCGPMSPYLRIPISQSKGYILRTLHLMQPGVLQGGFQPIAIFIYACDKSA